MNIHVSSTPRHLKITQTMIEDVLIDPVLGIKLLFGVTLDAFQASRQRTYHWIPDVMDSSATGTGKTLGLWLWANLRCVFIPDQHGLVLYQTLDSGKRFFWKHYRDHRLSTPLFRAQLGRMDVVGEERGRDNVKEPSYMIQYFKGGGQITMPAPSWMMGARTQAGEDVNWVIVEEWTQIDRSDNNAINERILSRVRRSSWNQHHPLWGNHRVFSASAESPYHPGWKRYQAFKREVDRGNPRFALISYSMKDYSGRRCNSGKSFREQYRDEENYRSMRAQLSMAEYKRQALGLWERETKGWYSEEALRKCVDAGVAAGLEVATGRGVEEMRIE